MAVILYHINSQWLSGGFVGVDIFFVISGFLITSIIHTEINHNSFCFSQFYQRRIKRILPLCFLVIFTTLIISYFLFSAREYVEHAKSVRYAISFMANLYFAKEQDYFAPNAEEIPLLHMWSLSVEEQYYFLWPALLLFFRKKIPAYTIHIAIFLACTSFVLSSFWAIQPMHTAQAYYLLPSRFGELMIGSIIALNSRPCNTGFIAAISSWTGLLLIAVSCIFLTKYSVFPGYNALWPCLGTALIIYAGTHHQLPLVNRLISHRAIVFIGLLSYSLYLWHWPILAYVRYYTMSSDLSALWVFFCLSTTFVLSYLSLRFIEKPLRRQKLNFKATFIRFFVAPTVILLGLCFVIKHTDGLFFNNESAGLDTIESPSLICHNDLRENCHLGKENQPAKTLIIGDSHTAHLTTFFDLLGKKQNWAADILSVDSCPPLTQFDLGLIDNQKQYLRCKKLIDRINSTIDQYDFVIYSLRWDLHFGYNHIPNYSPSPDFRSQLEHDIESLRAINKTVFIVGQVPLYTYNVARLYRTPYTENSLDLTYEKGNAIIRDIINNHSGVYYIDLSDTLKQWPNGMINGLPAYKDQNHLNVYGQKMLVNESDKFLWIARLINNH